MRPARDPLRLHTVPLIATAAIPFGIGVGGACGASDPDRSVAIGSGRTDGPGVQVVSNTVAAPPRGELVKPAKHLFGSEAEGPELFGGVADARLHPNRSLWIAERQTQEIRVFSDSMPKDTLMCMTIGTGEYRCWVLGRPNLRNR